MSNATNNPTSDNTPSPLLHINQFILGPSAARGLSDWRHLDVGSKLVLSSHPELNVTHVQDGNRALTLIGYILDPLSPSQNDEAILRDILPCTSAANTEFFRALERFGGRWVLLARFGDNYTLLNDALGLRQVFYVGNRDMPFWCASQSGLLATQLDLSVSADAKDFMASAGFRAHRENRWPGAATPFTELRHLLPNHCLDLPARNESRFWPTAPIQPNSSTASATDHSRSLLQGLVNAAAQRFNLTLGLTAGLDSRMVLAACKDLRERVDALTIRQRGSSTANNTDVTIAGTLCQKLGMEHVALMSPQLPSPEFEAAFKNNVLFAHDHYCADAEAILHQYGRKRVAMTGSGAEVGRLSFRKELPFSNFRRIDATDLADLQRMGQHPFLLAHFKQWLDDAQPAHDIPILDLFEWEQGHGNWLAMTQLEFDTAWRDIFTPFNCRELLVTFLSVPSSQREPPEGRFFLDLIRSMWPETLGEPINPGKLPSLKNTLSAARLVLRSVVDYLGRRPAPPAARAASKPLKSRKTGA